MGNQAKVQNHTLILKPNSNAKVVVRNHLRYNLYFLVLGYWLTLLLSKANVVVQGLEGLSGCRLEVEGPQPSRCSGKILEAVSRGSETIRKTG
jgi:hypothetical protein